MIASHVVTVLSNTKLAQSLSIKSIGTVAQLNKRAKTKIISLITREVVHLNLLEALVSVTGSE